MVGNAEETRKSKLDFESIEPPPPLQVSPKATPSKHTNVHCLTTAGGRVYESIGEKTTRIVVISNRVQLPHVSFTCLKTPNIIIMNINNQHGC